MITAVNIHFTVFFICKSLLLILSGYYCLLVDDLNSNELVVFFYRSIHNKRVTKRTKSILFLKWN